MGNAIDRYFSTTVAIRESIKTLRTNLQFVSTDDNVKSILITSAYPNEAKTTTCIYLALSLAEAGKRVLLLDCDLRRPMMAEYMDIPRKAGLVDYIAGTSRLSDIIVPTKCENLFFVDSGPKISNSVEILSSAPFESMLSELREEFDYVIIDTPPLGSFIEAAVLASIADGALLVVEHGKVEAKVAKSIVEQLKKAHAHILGVIFTNINEKYDNYYGSYGQYSYYDYNHTKKKGRKKNKKSKSRKNRY